MVHWASVLETTYKDEDGTPRTELIFTDRTVRTDILNIIIPANAQYDVFPDTGSLIYRGAHPRKSPPDKYHFEGRKSHCQRQGIRLNRHETAYGQKISSEMGRNPFLTFNMGINPGSSNARLRKKGLS